MTLSEAEKVVQTWVAAQQIVSSVYFFGSRVRGQHREDSDLDIAIEIIYEEDGTSLAHFMFEKPHWLAELQELLPWKLDIQRYHSAGTPTIAAGLVESSIVVYKRSAQPLVAADGRSSSSDAQ